MSDISVDATNFSEQLGTHDFFNVLIAGSAFLLGLCAVNSNINEYITKDIDIPRGFGLVILIYIVGCIIQELASIWDQYIFQIHRKTRNKFLNDINRDSIITNPMMLQLYRQSACKLLGEYIGDYGHANFNNDCTNRLIYTIYQYYAANKGKDHKIEKMRAIFNLSKTLTTSFALLALFALLSLFNNTEISINITGLFALNFGCPYNCTNKILLAIMFSFISWIFYLRTKNAMQRFLLVLYGTCTDLIRTEKAVHHTVSYISSKH